MTRARIHIIAVFFGFSSAIAQVLMVRELLTVFRGNELVIGMVFASWFLGVFLGARFNRPAAGDVLEKRLNRALILSPLLPPAAVYAAHIIPLAFPVPAGSFYPVTVELLFSLVLTAPVSFLTGRFFPPAVSLLSAHSPGRAGGAVFALESAGSFAGGVVFSFLLVDALNPLALSALLFSAALIVRRGPRMMKARLALALLPLAVVPFADGIEHCFFGSAWKATHAGSLLEYRRTRYQTVNIESMDGQRNVYGNGVYYYTLPDRYGARGMFHLSQALRPSGTGNVLVLGGGASSLVFNMLKSGVKELYYCESDPGLWEAVSSHVDSFYPREGRRNLRIVLQDYRKFLARTGQRFDMILCFPPPPENAMLNRFYTREFFRLCRERLADGGIFVTRIHGFSNYMGPELGGYIASVYGAFAREFPHRLVASGDTITLIGAAQPGALPPSPESLIASYAPRPREMERRGLEREIRDGFHPRELWMFFEKSQLGYFTERMNALLGEAGENTDLRPGAYWKYLLLSALQEDSLLYLLLKKGALILAAACAAIAWLLARIHRRHGPRELRGAAAILLTGCMSISVMVTLMLFYQNLYGVVYHRIALMNALFMLGLTAGSLAATRLRTRFSPGTGIFLLAASASAALCAVFPWEPVFWCVIPVFSAACGAVFPALFAFLGEGDIHRSASMLDAMDHLGAMAGSLLTAVAVIPWAGIPGAIAFAAALAAVVFFLSLRAERKI